MKKIAFVNQRYGLEVNGGSEYYTRLIAEKLVNNYDVHVITTKAIDYVTWKNYYKTDVEVINGVTVHRFPVAKTRNQNRFSDVTAQILSNKNNSDEAEQKWFDEQGPLSIKLVDYIEHSKDEYEVFIFVTYLYYNTVMGMPKVPEKSILIPTAHDEPYIHLNRFKTIFHMPQAFVFLTDEERKLVHGIFKNKNILYDTMGVGIEVTTEIDSDKFKKERKVSDYVIYVGRIDESKGCNLLFQYFTEYKKRQKSDLKLVLMGKSAMNIPCYEDIINLGFVDEEEKYNGIAGAKALILPSQFESLSISALEALSLGVPVIMNGSCEVLKGHCIKSNAGLYYRDYFEFEGCLNYLLSHDEAWKKMSENGKNYIDREYRWDIILNKFENILSHVAK